MSENPARGRAKLGRPADRRREIEASLRGRIADGTWAPGCRIPTRIELCEEFSAGATTIQRVLSAMEKDGFIHSSRSAGTHVTANPPPRANVAVVFPSDPHHNRFYRSLATVVRQPRGDSLRLAIYQQVDEHLDSEDSRRLLKDIRQCRLMGIVFAMPPSAIADSPIVTVPGIARCAIMAPNPRFPDLSTVLFNGISFQHRALEFLRARGRQRIAVAGYADAPASWEPVIAAAGLITHSWWLQSVDIVNASGCRRLAQLLVNPHQSERPDALIVLDDNTLEELATGIQDMAIEIPEALDIVSNCNFPLIPPSPLPVTYLGYSMAELLERALQALLLQRDGGPPSRLTLDADIAPHTAELAPDQEPLSPRD